MNPTASLVLCSRVNDVFNNTVHNSERPCSVTSPSPAMDEPSDEGECNNICGEYMNAVI